MHRAQYVTRLLNGARCSRTARLKVVLFFDPHYEKYRWRECVCDIMHSSLVIVLHSVVMLWSLTLNASQLTAVEFLCLENEFV